MHVTRGFFDDDGAELSGQRDDVMFLAICTNVNHMRDAESKAGWRGMAICESGMMQIAFDALTAGDHRRPPSHVTCGKPMT